MAQSKGFLRMLVPCTTAFLAGACIVILELVALRLVAGSLGSSLHTWTSVIGVVLTGIGVGTYLGGRIADRTHPRRALAVLFGLSSAASIGMIIMNNLLGNWNWLWYLGWPAHMLVHVALVFLAPSVLLGMLGPVVARMALDQGLAPGRTMGNVYAAGAAGAVTGIFLAGFYLIPTFGGTAIIWSIGAIMLALAVLYWVSCWAMYLWAMVFIALMTMGMGGDDWAREAGIAACLREPPDPNVLYEAQTPYGHAIVRQVSRRPNRRALWRDQSLHGEIVLDDVTNLGGFAARTCAAVTVGLSRDRRDLSVMVIGAGGYAFPRYLTTRWPGSRVEVVEIDPGMTKAATEALGLDKGTTIETVARDARSYVNQLVGRERGAGGARSYDFIYENVATDYAVPFQVLTREFNEKLHRLLADDGVYMVSLVDSADHGRFVGAVVNTLRETFGRVSVVTSGAHLPSLPAGFVVIAAERELELAALFQAYDPHLRLRVLAEMEIASLVDRAGATVLTDDFAPVENMLAPVARRGGRELLVRRLLHQAEDLQRKQELEPSIALYERAAALNPAMCIRAGSEMALMRLAQGRQDEAEKAFRKALDRHTAADTGDTAIAMVHHRLGVLLRQMGRPKEAQEHLKQAAQWSRIELQMNPRSFVVWDQLGETLATMGDFKGASDAFERAVALEPGNPAHYEKLARALEFQKRYGEAVEVVRRHISLVEAQGRRDLVSQLRPYLELLEYRNVKQSR